MRASSAPDSAMRGNTLTVLLLLAGAVVEAWEPMTGLHSNGGTADQGGEHMDEFRQQHSRNGRGYNHGGEDELFPPLFYGEVKLPIDYHTAGSLRGKRMSQLRFNRNLFISPSEVERHFLQEVSATDIFDETSANNFLFSTHFPTSKLFQSTAITGTSDQWPIIGSSSSLSDPADLALMAAGRAMAAADALETIVAVAAKSAKRDAQTQALASANIRYNQKLTNEPQQDDSNTLDRFPLSPTVHIKGWKQINSKKFTKKPSKTSARKSNRLQYRRYRANRLYSKPVARRVLKRRYPRDANQASDPDIHELTELVTNRSYSRKYNKSHTPFQRSRKNSWRGIPSRSKTSRSKTKEANGNHNKKIHHKLNDSGMVWKVETDPKLYSGDRFNMGTKRIKHIDIPKKINISGKYDIGSNNVLESRDNHNTRQKVGTTYLHNADSKGLDGTGLHHHASNIGNATGWYKTGIQNAGGSGEYYTGSNIGSPTGEYYTGSNIDSPTGEYYTGSNIDSPTGEYYTGSNNAGASGGYNTGSNNAGASGGYNALITNMDSHHHSSISYTAGRISNEDNLNKDSSIRGGTSYYNRGSSNIDKIELYRTGSRNIAGTGSFNADSKSIAGAGLYHTSSRNTVGTDAYNIVPKNIVRPKQLEPNTHAAFSRKPFYNIDPNATTDNEAEQYNQAKINVNVNKESEYIGKERRKGFGSREKGYLREDNILAITRLNKNPYKNGDQVLSAENPYSDREQLKSNSIENVQLGYHSNFGSDTEASSRVLQSYGNDREIKQEVTNGYVSAKKIETSLGQLESLGHLGHPIEKSRILEQTMKKPISFHRQGRSSNIDALVDYYGGWPAGQAIQGNSGSQTVSRDNGGDYISKMKSIQRVEVHINPIRTHDQTTRNEPYKNGFNARKSFKIKNIANKVKPDEHVQNNHNISLQYNPGTSTTEATSYGNIHLNKKNSEIGFDIETESNSNKGYEYHPLTLDPKGNQKTQTKKYLLNTDPNQSLEVQTRNNGRPTRNTRKWSSSSCCHIQRMHANSKPRRIVGQGGHGGEGGRVYLFVIPEKDYSISHGVIEGGEGGRGQPGIHHPFH